MKINVVIIRNQENGNARRACEQVENRTFNNVDELRNALLCVYDIEKFICLELTDFMDAVNDQELDDLTNSFISYVKLKN